MVENKDESKPIDEKAAVQKRLKEIEQQSKKKKSQDTLSVAQQIATRSKLERDYNEDTIHVTFKSSPETERTVIARRPNNKEYIEILTLGIQASKYENNPTLEAISKLTDILDKFGIIAAQLTVDNLLNEDFWNTKISSIALQNFINALISSSQSFGGLSEQELTSFR